MPTKNKIAIVTGATAGIGRAIAIDFAKDGFHVAVCGTNSERGDETVEIIKSTGGLATFHAGDVSSPSDVVTQMTEISQLKDEHQQLKQIAVLVNNAGHCQVKAILDITPDEIKRMFEVHVLGAYLYTQAVVPFMKANNYGRIINITSSNGAGASEFTSHYQAAKAAQHSFTKSCALTFRSDGITVNSVSPSTVITKLFYENDDNYKKYLGRSAADELARREIASPKVLVTVEEVARVVSFLANDASGRINGEVIGV